MHFYNDTEPFVCLWLEQLTKHNHLPHGTIDQRPIQQLTAADLVPYTQCHFFAGIGGWPLALKLAGWPDDMPVWTGSCPCQPFSCAGKGLREADERHLWPEFRRLIAECKPPVVFGEQVASKAGRLWLDGVRTDLEALGYVVGASGLCAYAVGAPHERLRSFWVAYSTSNGCQGLLKRLVTQISQNRPPKALAAWHGTGHPFEQWQKLLAGTCVRRMADGVSSCVDIRPALRGYGNAIVPPLAAEFIQASVEALQLTGL